jgi:hypothetical protein
VAATTRSLRSGLARTRQWGRSCLSRQCVVTRCRSAGLPMAVTHSQSVFARVLHAHTDWPALTQRASSAAARDTAAGALARRRLQASQVHGDSHAAGPDGCLHPRPAGPSVRYPNALPEIYLCHACSYHEIFARAVGCLHELSWPDCSKGIQQACWALGSATCVWWSGSCSGDAHLGWLSQSVVSACTQSSERVRWRV